MNPIRRPILVAALATAAGALSPSAGAASAVIPFPGTPDASPRTQIIFSSLARAQLRSVTVRGSRSGLDMGHLTGLPDGAGTAFVPARAFSPGERVQVRARGRTGAPISFSFTVARPVAEPATARSDRLPSSGGPPTQYFRSQPGLHPPVVDVTTARGGGDGEIFLGVQGQHPGPMILDGRGRMIWFKPLQHGEADNVEVQHYRGHPVLTWWQGNVYSGGHDVIMSRRYRPVATVHAGNGYRADVHEFQITPQGTALIDAYVPVTMNLTSVGGPASAPALDCVIQEVDIRSGRVLWEWHTMGHIPLRASYVRGPFRPLYDPYHLNSIQQLPSGNLLISLRDTWAVYEISKRTGKVIWSLGGKHPSFSMGPGTNFEWQHDARLAPDGTLTLFDDAALPQEERQSSAKVMRLDPRARTVTLVHRFTHSPPLLAGVAGSAQILANGDLFVGWGSGRAFSEYSPGGRTLFDATFAIGVGTYRAYRFPWVAQPVTRPALALSRTPHGAVKLFVSWNGATQIAAWRFLGGSARGHLRQIGATAPWTGFETGVRRETADRFFAAQALDAGGDVLATSGVKKL